MKPAFLALILVAALPGILRSDELSSPVRASHAKGTSVRVAAISFVPVKFDLKGNADRLEAAFRSAQKGGAEIAVAPEGILEGYVVNEIIAGKAKPEAMKEVALTRDDPVIRRFQELARELKMSLVFGFAERIKDEVFNCAVFIDDEGRICGSHHKMQLAEGSHPDWWFNRLGARSRAFDTPYGRCGIVICNERWNPQLARILALDGARFLVIPSYGTKSRSQDDAVLRLGRENGVPIVEANVGVTLVVNDGNVTAVDRKEEGITFGEITIPPAVAAQPAECDRAQHEFLVWREAEMKARYIKTAEHSKPKAAATEVSRARPNILFIISDDQSSLDLKAYNPASTLRTPNLDRLAAGGMTFTGAYHMGAFVSGVCLPSRYMIKTGRTLWHLPVAPEAQKHCPANIEENTIAAIFNRAGYDTMRVGKRGNSYEAAKKLFTINIEPQGRSGLEPEGSAWHADQLLNCLAEREAGNDQDPFLIYFGFSHPHDPRNGTQELLAKYGAVNHDDPNSLPAAHPLQPKLPANYLPTHPFPTTLLPDQRDETQVIGVWKNRDERTIRNEIGRYFACSENVDIQIGRVVQKLEAMGELENTWIFYTSDHGIAIGRHGLQGKQNLYQHTWRVPFIAKGPGIKPASRVEGNIYLLDVIATLCDIAGFAPPESNEGISFKPVLEGRQQTTREVLYGVHCGGTKPGMRCVKKGDWKLIKYDGNDGTVHETQLFNLAENPDELLKEHHAPAVIALTGVTPEKHQVNLAGDPRYAEKLAEMEALLLSEMRRLHDPWRLWNQPGDNLPPPPEMPPRGKAKEGKQVSHEVVPAGETAVNAIGLKLVRVPAGEFMMGSPPQEKGRRQDEPQRKVRLTRDYEIGKFEVTRGQFRKFVEAAGYKTDAERGLRGGYGVDGASKKLMGPDHKYSWRFTGFEQTDDHPVVNVSWNDAMAFCRWLTDQEKRAYRLPTEAEWEYACRGGASSAYANGDDPEKVVEIGNIMDAPTKQIYADRIAVAGSDGFIFTAPAGSFRANAFGIHDMHGNVWEWTADWFAPPPATAQVDPKGPESAKDKVVRGGDWYHDWSFARSAQRFPIYPGLCRRHAGFRVVREVSP